jgi:hypothetical protein
VHAKSARPGSSATRPGGESHAGRAELRARPAPHPGVLGERSQADPRRTIQAKRALELLAAARLCHLVRYSAATGIPLGGDATDKFRKAILLDIGLFHALADTPAGDRFAPWHDLAPGVRGQLAEQLVGEALLLSGAPTGDGPRLFYWQREGGRPGEIDFLIQAGGRIVPIELKSGASGAMKSLHQFMFDKKLRLAVRIDENPPSLATIDVTTTQGDPVRYRLLGLPIYLAWRAIEIAASIAR